MKIAEKTGCPVVPMAISNTRQILMAHMPRVTPTHVVIEYGKPIYPKELSRDERKNLGRMAQEIIAETMEKNKALIAK